MGKQALIQFSNLNLQNPKYQLTLRRPKWWEVALFFWVFAICIQPKTHQYSSLFHPYLTIQNNIPHAKSDLTLNPQQGPLTNPPKEYNFSSLHSFHSLNNFFGDNWSSFKQQHQPNARKNNLWKKKNKSKFTMQKTKDTSVSTHHSWTRYPIPPGQSKQEPHTYKQT